MKITPFLFAFHFTFTASNKSHISHWQSSSCNPSCPSSFTIVTKHLLPLIMEILILLIGFSLLVALCFLAGFAWAVKDGQFEDDFTPSIRILQDDEPFNRSSPETKAEQP